MHSIQLFFVREFLDREFSSLICEEYENTRSSQLKARYSSREVQSKLAEGLYEIEYKLNPKKLRRLSSKEKLMAYLALRLISIDTESGFWRLLFSDYESFLKSINFDESEEYLYYSQLKDNFFVYEIDCLLWKQTTRRELYRKINSRVANSDIQLLDYLDLLAQEFCLPIIRPKHKAKRKIRHKGYRDHGSLGSEISRTLKDQKDDWTLREEALRREKNKRDYLALLRGLAGLE